MRLLDPVTGIGMAWVTGGQFCPVFHRDGLYKVKYPSKYSFSDAIDAIQDIWWIHIFWSSVIIIGEMKTNMVLGNCSITWRVTLLQKGQIMSNIHLQLILGQLHTWLQCLSIYDTQKLSLLRAHDWESGIYKVIHWGFVEIDWWLMGARIVTSVLWPFWLKKKQKVLTHRMAHWNQEIWWKVVTCLWNSTFSKPSPRSSSCERWDRHLMVFAAGKPAAVRRFARCQTSGDPPAPRARPGWNWEPYWPN